MGRTFGGLGMAKRKAKYGTAHDKARSHWADLLMERGSLPCTLCPRPVVLGQSWHLDHVPGTVDIYRGVAHRGCNTRDGARRGNAMRKKRAFLPL